MTAAKAQEATRLVRQLLVDPATAVRGLQKLYPESSRILFEHHAATGLVVYYAAGSRWARALPTAIRHAAFLIIEVASDGSFVVQKDRDPEGHVYTMAIDLAIVEKLRGPGRSRWRRLLEDDSPLLSV